MVQGILGAILGLVLAIGIAAFVAIVVTLRGLTLQLKKFIEEIVPLMQASRIKLIPEKLDEIVETGRVVSFNMKSLQASLDIFTKFVMKPGESAGSVASPSAPEETIDSGVYTASEEESAQQENLRKLREQGIELVEEPRRTPAG